jgi:hypothetical protein
MDEDEPSNCNCCPVHPRNMSSGAIAEEIAEKDNLEDV